ncbi:MAG TPA: hypothetical protein VHM24_11220 [Gemmatimonadaceae bacterium]|nr:hypothetical protein [Gemmatimonadaceae bacterium]
MGASVMAMGLAAIYWLARIGFDNPPWPVVRAAGLALLLINSPYAVRMLIRRRTLEYGWGTSYSFLWLLTIALAGAVGWAVPLIGFSPFIPLALLAVVGFLILFVDWARHSGWRAAGAMILAAGFFSTWAAGVVWGRIYKSPLFLEMLMLDGKVHHDGITLAALGNMIRTYGVPSMGLDGLPYMSYHWGTPWLFAQWSNLTGTSVMEFYQLVFPVTMIPFFFGGLVAFGLEARYAIYQRRMADMKLDYARQAGAFDPRLGPTFWLVFLSATVGMIPITGMDALGVWTSNLMISESYTVGVPVALLLFATTIVFWQCGGDEVLRNRGTAKDWVFLAVVLPAGLVALGYLKISLMVLGFLAAVYGALRTGAFRKRSVILIIVLATLLVGITYPLVSLAAHREGVVPLDFLQGFVPLEWWPFFFLFHLFWSAFYVVLRLRQEGARTIGDFLTLARNRRILDVELVGLVALAGVAPGLVIHIDGGSAFYFSDVQRWVSVGLLLAGVGTLLPRLPRWRWTDLRMLAIAFALLPMAVSMSRNSLHWTKRMLRANAATRAALYPVQARGAIPEGIRGLSHMRDPAILEAGLRSARNANPVRGLLEIGNLSPLSKRHTAVFVPQTEERYWTLLSRPGACAFSGFVVPALAGLSMIDGMPPAGCRLSPYYGLSLYQPRRTAQTPDDETPAVLCRRALRLGFRRVLTLRFDQSGRLDRQPTECLRKK